MSAGGVILGEHRVTEIIPGQEVTVKTTKATFRTEKLVITAGSWTADLLRTLELEIPFEVIVLGYSMHRSIYVGFKYKGTVLESGHTKGLLEGKFSCISWVCS